MIEGSRVYIPAIYAVNKIDQITLEELNVMEKLPHYCPICAFLEWNLDGLVEMVWEYLDLVRVYTKPKGRLPDFNEPVVLHRGKSSCEDFCNKIHKVRPHAPMGTCVKVPVAIIPISFTISLPCRILLRISSMQWFGGSLPSIGLRGWARSTCFRTKTLCRL